MRIIMALPIVAAALIAAQPALADPVAAQDSASESEMVAKLNDPVFQEGIVNMVSGMMAAMMDLPIGQIAATMEHALPEDMKKRGDLDAIDPDATIGDLAHQDDPDFARNIEDKMRGGVAMAGLMASELDVLLPQLRALGKKMKQRMSDLD